MQRLPEDGELTKLFRLGLSDSEVAAQYGVSRQAVQKRWRRMGLVRLPIVQEVKELIHSGWDIDARGTEAGSPQLKWISQNLRVVLRRRLGDTVSPRVEARAAQWLNMLQSNGWIVDYSPELSWHYTEREPGDRNWIVRWPEDRPLPSPRHQAALEMCTTPEGKLVPVGS